LACIGFLVLVPGAEECDLADAAATPPSHHASDRPSTELSHGHMEGLPKPTAADVASSDALIAAYYDSLSTSAGKKRNRDRFLSLFFPGARLLPAEGKGHSGMMPHSFTAQSFLFDTEPHVLEAGLIEKEVARRTESFGKILHAFSTYEARHAASDPHPFVRGVNSFQLFFDGRRWWIASLIWQPETTKFTLPSDYLPR